jgi:hypothetical protein
MIEECFAHESIEDIIIHLENQDELGPKLAGLIKKASPLALHITAELLKQGAVLDRRQCLQLEHRVIRQVGMIC